MAFIDPLVGPSGTGNAWDTRRTFDAVQLQMNTGMVRVFGSAAARDQAITAPKDGQVVYLNTGDATEGLYSYNGSAWVPAGGTTAWQSWTPTISASTTNPTLGTGAVQEGFYFQVGKLVIAQAFIAFGTSGVNAGSGVYSIPLPVTADTSTTRNMVTGSFYASDASSGVQFAGGVTMTQGTTYPSNGRMFYTTAYPTSGLAEVAATVPWTWAANDQLRATFTYRAA